MFDTQQSLYDIVHTIQVALTPVFLLSAIASLLGVFATRLARVADKVDALTEKLDCVSETERMQIIKRLGYLRRRSHALDAAVILGALAGASTSSAALLLFVGTLRNATGSILMFIAFGAALIFTIGALGVFLFEMLIAGRGIRDLVAAKNEQTESEMEQEHELADHNSGTEGDSNNETNGANAVE